MELVWDIYHAVLKWMVDRGPIYTERLFGAAMKMTAEKLFLVLLRFIKSDSVRGVIFYYYYCCPPTI